MLNANQTNPEVDMTIKSAIYKGLRISNDINAVAKGRVGKRLARRALGWMFGKLIRALVK